MSNTAIRTQHRSNYLKYILISDKSGLENSVHLFHLLSCEWKCINTHLDSQIQRTSYRLNDGRILDLGKVFDDEEHSLTI